MARAKATGGHAVLLLFSTLGYSSITGNYQLIIAYCSVVVLLSTSIIGWRALGEFSV